MSRVKWKVMSFFKLLPSSPSIRQLNDIQWSWCYLNIMKDEEEEEKKWKERLTYQGFLANPQFTAEYLKSDNSYASSSSSSNNAQETVADDHFTNSDFEKELQAALHGEDIMEVPEPEGTRGNPVISSEDFISSLEQNIDKYETLQQQADLEVQAKLSGVNVEDLDLIQIDDDEEE
jgi:hypothetical protein